MCLNVALPIISRPRDGRPQLRVVRGMPTSLGEFYVNLPFFLQKPHLPCMSSSFFRIVLRYLQAVRVYVLVLLSSDGTSSMGAETPRRRAGRYIHFDLHSL